MIKNHPIVILGWGEFDTHPILDFLLLNKNK